MFIFYILFSICSMKNIWCVFVCSHSYLLTIVLVAERYTRKEILPIALTCIPPKPYRGRLELISIKLHVVEGWHEQKVGWADRVYEDFFCDGPSCHICFYHHRIGMRVVTKLEVRAVKGCREMGPLWILVWTRTGHTVHPSHALFALSFVAMIIVGSTGDCEYYAEGCDWVVDCCLDRLVSVFRTNIG